MSNSLLGAIAQGGVDPFQRIGTMVNTARGATALQQQRFDLQQAQLQPAYMALNSIKDNPNLSWDAVNAAIGQSARLGANIDGLTANATEAAAQGMTPADFARIYGMRMAPAGLQYESMLPQQGTMQTAQGTYMGTYGAPGGAPGQVGVFNPQGGFVGRGVSPEWYAEPYTIATPQGPRIVPRGSVWGGAIPGMGAGGGARAGGAAASAQDLMALPDVQRLAPNIRSAAVDAMTNAGLDSVGGAQFARMLMQESSGGRDLRTSSAGAIGPAQVMPATFTQMQKKYGIQGGINDTTANLNAGARYFREGLDASGGSLAGGAIYYNAGPDRLAQVMQGGSFNDLPPETQDYLARTTPGAFNMASSAAPVATSFATTTQPGGMWNWGAQGTTGAAPGVPYFPPNPAMGGGGGPSPNLPGVSNVPGVGPMVSPLSPFQAPLLEQSSKDFVADQVGYRNLQARIQPLQNAISLLQANPDLKTGPSAAEWNNWVQGLASMGINVGDVKQADQYNELVKNLAMNLRASGANRSDLERMENEAASPNTQQGRDAIIALAAENIGFQRVKSAQLLQYQSLRPGGYGDPNSAVNNPQFYHQETADWAATQDPMAYASDLLPQAALANYIKGLTTTQQKKNYVQSLQDAKRLFNIALPVGGAGGG